MWETLQHNGPLFPAPYEPHGVPLPLVGGGAVAPLPAAVEEALTVFAHSAAAAAARESGDEVFWDNFEASLRPLAGGAAVPDLADVDLAAFAAATPAPARPARLSAEEVETYGKCVCDGEERTLAEFRLPAGRVFHGRGLHPQRGRYIRRLEPEDVVINVCEDTEPPACPAGHRWARIVHRREVNWVAAWTDEIFGAHKFMWMMPAEGRGGGGVVIGGGVGR